MTEDRHLLVVEDTKNIRDLLEKILPYTVTFAHSQDEAYSELHLHNFDLILLDLKLPRTEGDMSPERQVGVDILKTIRAGCILQKDGGRPVPVVAMTAFGDMDLLDEIYSELGVSFYQEKPFGHDHQLELKIERALNGEGAGPPSPGHMKIRIALRPGIQSAQIETYICTNAEYQIVERLAREWPSGKGIEGKVVAREIGVSEETFRKRVARFRKNIDAHFQASDISISGNDVLTSTSWHGYRLNEVRVSVINFSTLELTGDL